MQILRTYLHLTAFLTRSCSCHLGGLLCKCGSEVCVDGAKIRTTSVGLLIKVLKHRLISGLLLPFSCTGCSASRTPPERDLITATDPLGPSTGSSRVGGVSLP